MKREYSQHPEGEPLTPDVLQRWIAPEVDNQPLPEEQETVIEVDPRKYTLPFRPDSTLDEYALEELRFMPTVYTPSPWIRFLFVFLLFYFFATASAFTYLYFTGVKIDGWLN